MRDRRRALTLIEAVFVVLVCALLALLFVPMFQRAREESNRKACAEHLRQVTKAYYHYTQSRSEYFPFSWMPAGEGAPRRKDAMTSIGEVYPQYMANPNVFRCPSTADRPRFAVNLPVNATPASGKTYLYSNRNWTLADSSYGYDCRVYPAAVSNHAVWADLDGSGGPTSNHRGGQNVAYVDGHVAWKTTSFCSNDPLDNIFIEDPWSADTDSYISVNKRPGDRTGPADQYNDLTVSYMEYTALHPGGDAP